MKIEADKSAVAVFIDELIASSRNSSLLSYSSSTNATRAQLVANGDYVMGSHYVDTAMLGTENDGNSVVDLKKYGALTTCSWWIQAFIQTCRREILKLWSWSSPRRLLNVSLPSRLGQLPLQERAAPLPSFQRPQRVRSSRCPAEQAARFQLEQPRHSQLFQRP